jgi:TatD DNase family protein
VGFDAASNQAAVELAAADPRGWATAGIHPHDATTYDDAVESNLRDLAAAGSIVAIGECGLDFFRDLSPRDVQQRTFRRQIALAKQLDLPLVLHVRDAYAPTKEVLEDEGLPPRRGVFHAFAGDADFARWAVDEGFWLGIGGPLTYKNSRLPQAIDGLPPSSFLLETDAPWLPPQPWRGRRNEPAYLRCTAQVLADLCRVSLGALSETTRANFESIFRVRMPEDMRALDVTACSPPAAGR